MGGRPAERTRGQGRKIGRKQAGEWALILARFFAVSRVRIALPRANANGHRCGSIGVKFD